MGWANLKKTKEWWHEWESLSGAEKSEFKKNYAMRRGITIDFICRWAWNEGDLDNLEYHIAERRKKFREF